MKTEHGEEPLNLKREWECKRRFDPREAIRSDYLTGLRSPRDTLATIVALAMDGLIPATGARWWPRFVEDLLQAVRTSKNS